MRTRTFALARGAAPLPRAHRVRRQRLLRHQGQGDRPAARPGGKADCAPVAGDQLVVLEDDQQLQTVDNIIPAVNAEASSDALLEALNAVSAALDTDTLISLNKQTDIDRKTSPNVAKQFVEDEGLADGLSGGSGKIVVGHANFSENATLANIYAEVLNAAGFDASVKQLGNREVYLPALEKGDHRRHPGVRRHADRDPQQGARTAPRPSRSPAATWTRPSRGSPTSASRSASSSVSRRRRRTRTPSP